MVEKTIAEADRKIKEGKMMMRMPHTTCSSAEKSR
jgi:hypothetical protein